MKRKIFVFFGAIILCFAWQIASGETWRELLDTADSLSVAQNQDSAIVVGNLALEKAEAEFGAQDTAVARILHQIGLYSYYKADYGDAGLLLERALLIREKALGPEHADLAASLSSLGNVYYEQVRYAEAELVYKRALAIYEKVLGPEHPHVAQSLNNVALIISYKGEYVEAESLYKRGLAIWEKSFGSEHPEVAYCLRHLGDFYAGQSRYAEAESVIGRALAIYEKALGPEHPNTASTLNSLADIYHAQARYAEAEPLLLRSMAIREKVFGPEHPDVARCQGGLADLYRFQGKYGEAERLYRKSLSIWESSFGPEHLNVVASLHNLATLYLDQGRYAEAEPPFKGALVTVEKVLGQDHIWVAICLRSLADLYIRQGKYVEAEPLYERALSIDKKALGPDHLGVAQSLANLANVYRDHGRDTEAERLHKKALNIFEKVVGPDHPDVARSLGNLGHVYKDQGKYAEAESLYRRSFTILESTLGPQHPDVADALENTAILCTERGDYAEAEQLFGQALQIKQESLGRNHPRVAGTAESMCELRRLQGHDTTAVKLAERACRIRHMNFEDNAMVLSEKDALTYSQFLRSSVNLYLTCYFDLRTRDNSATRKATDIILSSKGQVSDWVFELQQVLVRETDSVTLALAESLRLNKHRLSQLYVQGPGEDVEGYRNEVDSLTELANELEADLTRHSASFRKQKDYRDISVDRLMTLLPQKSVLVEFLRYDHGQLKSDSTVSGYLAVVLADDDPVVVNLGGASEIEPLISTYRQHLLRVPAARKMPNVVDQEDYQRIADELYRRIWQPIERYLENKDLVLLAPDGALNMVSFAGLTDGEGKYLIEEFPLHYLSSGRDLVRIKDEVERASGLFALGDPDYDASASARLPESTTSFDKVLERTDYVTRNIRSGCGKLSDMKVRPLPGTGKEIQRIAARWRESVHEPAVICLGTDASEENFKVKAPGNRVVHLATHGYFLEGACQPEISKQGLDLEIGFVGENPLLLSGLFLAGANLHGEGADSLGAEDGILTAEEVTAMNLNGTELVVLSACETGLGEVKAGEGVYGLRRAFQMAGARTVISALWPVSDKATAEMMSKLYERKAKSLPDRIRELQLEKINELRNLDKPDHPFSWGAFIALGDWR